MDRSLHERVFLRLPQQKTTHVLGDDKPSFRKGSESLGEEARDLHRPQDLPSARYQADLAGQSRDHQEGLGFLVPDQPRQGRDIDLMGRQDHGLGKLLFGATKRNPQLDQQRRIVLVNRI